MESLMAMFASVDAETRSMFFFFRAPLEKEK